MTANIVCCNTRTILIIIKDPPQARRQEDIEILLNQANKTEDVLYKVKQKKTIVDLPLVMVPMHKLRPFGKDYLHKKDIICSFPKTFHQSKVSAILSQTTILNL